MLQGLRPCCVQVAVALLPIRPMLVCVTLPRYHCDMQGFWPDGIYVAPTDEALKSDIVVSKQMGYNMLRKHIKVERDRSVPLCFLCSSYAATCCACPAWHGHDPTTPVQPCALILVQSSGLTTPLQTNRLCCHHPGERSPGVSLVHGSSADCWPSGPLNKVMLALYVQLFQLGATCRRKALMALRLSLLVPAAGGTTGLTCWASSCGRTCPASTGSGGRPPTPLTPVSKAGQAFMLPWVLPSCWPACCTLGRGGGVATFLAVLNEGWCPSQRCIAHSAA